MLNPDRWLEAGADAHLMREQREDEARHELVDLLAEAAEDGLTKTAEDYVYKTAKQYTEVEFDCLLASNSKAAKAWSRMERGLPPFELACDFCPSMDAKDFDGVAVCKKCCESDGGIRICRDCGETEFLDHPEGPTMCVHCRSMESDYAPDWED